MFKMSNKQIDELCHFANLSDKEIRSDLCRGYIKNEDDYTSNFTGALRRNINTYAISGLSASSFTVNATIEHKYGCDAVIIISSNNESKIILFEAKWPRLSKKYRWDYYQKSTNTSHYSTQLDRQSIAPKSFAIFEIFYCEYPPKKQPLFMQDEVSTCVWHKTAINFNNTQKTPTDIWSQKNLIDLLNIESLKISDIIKEVCVCNIGIPLPITDPEKIIKEFNLKGEILFININKER